MHSQNLSDFIRLNIGKLGRNFKLSRNFELYELQSSCGAQIIFIHPALLILLQSIRDIISSKYVASRLIVTRGFSTQKANKKADGADSSLHLKGAAADIVGFRDGSIIDFGELLDACIESDAGGIAVYSRHIHVDVGPKRTWKTDGLICYENTIRNHLKSAKKRQ